MSGTTSDLGTAWRLLDKARAERDAAYERTAELTAELNAVTAERDDLSARVDEQDRIIGDYQDVIVTVQRERDDLRAALADRFAKWRERAGLDDIITGAGTGHLAAQLAEGGPVSDVRPRDGEPGWYDVTCGACGEEFGTNFPVEEIECAECEARRCPHCAHWFRGA